jgi:hypothetical protein
VIVRADEALTRCLPPDTGPDDRAFPQHSRWPFFAAQRQRQGPVYDIRPAHGHPRVTQHSEVRQNVICPRLGPAAQSAQQGR